MSKKSKRTVIMAVIGVLAVAIIIGIIVVGVNIFKNRWHKINFQVESISVKNIASDPFQKDEYYVTVKGTAKTWFYDFNTYKFNFVGGASGEHEPHNVDYGGTVTANRSDGNEFEISFYADSISDVECFVFGADNIYKDGVKKDAIDIRLYLKDYLDKFVIE